MELKKHLNTYLSEGSKVIHSIWNEYNSRKEELQKIEDGKSTRNKKDVLNLEMIKRWKDIVGAYDSLDEFQDELLERNKMFDTIVMKKLRKEIIYYKMQ